ncbi:MAG: M15 family metallopeptidase [Synechococcus sp. SB0668_bin_15]|nr:M15 family metallopeptidase [Synechococcus sp. SB0668_bin_15]MYC49423.1 M15 family metallopeptidase [Synechococcus sp. SB0662_bin_14]
MPDATERPWLALAINDCGEPLAPLPEDLPRVMPHPYACLGAPYPGDPWRLRLAVVVRLLRARTTLQAAHPGWDLQIFDAWRPIAVQAFMVNHSLQAELARGSPSQRADPAWRCQVEQQVRHLWAIPSRDPGTPPPHSTGAAVDLTLVDHDGEPVPMGSPIDALGPESYPDHFAGDPHGATAHRNRLRLRQAMLAAGFVLHPWEWWHFSFGDQLWAWRTGQVAARYGAYGNVTGGQPVASR